MNEVQLTAFLDELEKTAFSFAGLWEKFTDLFPTDSRAKKRVKQHFSPKAGNEKWKKFPSHTRDKKFLKQLSTHPESDPKLIQHAQGMHELARGRTIGKVQSSAGGGKSYEIRKTNSGPLACTCNDWRFKGSISPGYECKHIKAHKAGKVKVGMERSSFSQQMSGFFDELTDIVNQEQAQKEEGMDKRDDRPYSSLLTQDEEPVQDYNPQQADEAEPEVITRGGS